MNKVQEIQQDIQKYEAHAKLGEAFERLRRNSDFQAVIEQLYFRDEAIRLVQAKANPQCQNPIAQAGILRDMDAIGSLQQFFNNLVQGAYKAAEAAAQARAELLIAENEEDEDEEGAE